MSGQDFGFGALTIDTCVFEAHEIALEKGLFKHLQQFAGAPVKFIMSDIVGHEVRMQLSERVKDARNKVNQALRASGSHLLTSGSQLDNAKALIFGSGNDLELVDGRLATFYKNTGAEIVQASKATTADLVRLYFNANAPFETTADKKSEFPDALALLSLEAWAKERGVKVLAVSSDKGWKNFAENSDYIEVTETLGDALSRFQPQGAAKEIINELRGAIASGQTNPALGKIREAISYSLADADIHIDATSAHHFEQYDVFANYADHEFIDSHSGGAEINLVRIELDKVVLHLLAQVTCEVHCSFSLSGKNPIDKNYLSMGTTSASQEETYQTEILLTLNGKIAEGLKSLSVADVEVLDTIAYADFGEIELDWSCEE